VGFGDFISSLTGLFSSSVSPTQSATNAGTQGQQDRATAQTQGTTLAQNFHGEYLPEGVTAMMESFDTMSHDRIIQYRDKVVPNDMNESAGRWRTLADDTHTKATLFQGAIEGLINNGWSGASAESAKASVRTYVDDVDTLKNAAAIVATKISDAAATLTQVKAQIPDKPQNRATSFLGIVTDVVANTVGAGGSSIAGQLMADHGRASNAENSARDVMNNVYKKYLPESDTNVPKMPGVTTADNTSHTGASGPSGPSSSYGPSSNSNAHSYGPSTSNSPTGASGPSSPSSSTSSSTSPSSLNLPDAKTGTSANLSGLSSSMSGTNTSTAGYSPSGVGTAGTTGTGGFNSSTGGRGSGVPGTTGTTTTTAATATTAAGKTTSGMPGMMGGAGQKGKGEGDGEHKTPEWLKGIQEELVGPSRNSFPAA
jgi:PPE family